MLAIQVRAARDVTAAELARLVGLPPGAAIEPAAALEPPAPETLAIDALIETARGRRADRAALLKRAEAAGERARAAVAGTKPALSAAGGFDYASPNPRIFPREERWRTSWDVSLNASWQLFDGGKVHADVAEAAALARAARARLADLDAALDLEIRQRATELDSSRAAISAADAAVRSATEARRVIGDRFRAGVATSTDVVDAQLALLQAELDRTQAVTNARIARARLDRALGR